MNVKILKLSRALHLICAYAVRIVCISIINANLQLNTRLSLDVRKDNTKIMESALNVRFHSVKIVFLKIWQFVSIAILAIIHQSLYVNLVLKIVRIAKTRNYAMFAVLDSLFTKLLMQISILLLLAKQFLHQDVVKGTNKYLEIVFLVNLTVQFVPKTTYWILLLLFASVQKIVKLLFIKSIRILRLIVIV